MFSVDPLGERLKGTVVATADRAFFLFVVDQSVYRLLQHAPLVAQDDLRRSHID